MSGLQVVFHAPLSFARTLAYIARYEIEQRRAVRDGALYQVLGDSAGCFLVRIEAEGENAVRAEIIKGRRTNRREVLLKKCLARTFGSDDLLLSFYRFARRDPILRKLVDRFRGVRLVGMVDLWECLLWSVIGQQVSVASAFSVRSRLARRASAVVEWEGSTFEGFPTPQDYLSLSSAAVLACGFSRQKERYVRDIARQFARCSLSDEGIASLPFEEARRRLLALRGIGPWSAEYAMMRAVGDPDACPFEDIGLRNAITSEYGLAHQATVAETQRISAAWRPFRAYATFYLWQTLFRQEKTVSAPVLGR
jgi:DNA-3-methyladenine glycosylase II